MPDNQPDRSDEESIELYVQEVEEEGKVSFRYSGSMHLFATHVAENVMDNHFPKELRLDLVSRLPEIRSPDDLIRAKQCIPDDLETSIIKFIDEASQAWIDSFEKKTYLV